MHADKGACLKNNDDPGDSLYQKFLVDAVCMNNFGRLQK